MTRSRRIKELLAAQDYIGLELYQRANILKDSGWVVARSNKQGTIRDYMRTMSFRQEPDTYELNRLVNSITANYNRAWVQLAPLTYRFTATLDTSD